MADKPRQLNPLELWFIIAGMGGLGNVQLRVPAGAVLMGTKYERQTWIDNACFRVFVKRKGQIYAAVDKDAIDAVYCNELYPLEAVVITGVRPNTKPCQCAACARRMKLE